MSKAPGAHKRMDFFAKLFPICLILINWGRINIHLSPFITLSFGGTTTSVIVPLFVVYLILKRAAREQKFFHSAPLPVIIFFFYCLGTLLWTHPFDFFFFNTVLVPSVLAYLMLGDLLRRDPAYLQEKFLPLFTISPLLIVARGLVDSPQYLINEGKLDSPADHHTLVAMNLLMMLPLVMGMLLRDDKRKLYYGVTLVLTILGIVLCGSRVGLVVLFLEILIGLFLFAGRQIRLIGAVALIVSVLFLYALPMTHQRFVGLRRLGDDPYMVTRTRIWDMTSQIVKDHLLFGVGFSQKTFLALGKERFGYQNGEPVFFYEHPHNLYLQILAFLGIAGTLIFLWLSADVGWKLMWLEKKEKAWLAKPLIIGFLGFLVMNLVEGALNSGRMMTNLFLIFAIIDYMVELEKREENSPGKA